MTAKSGLTVRQHERADVSLHVELVIADQHRGQIRFSPSSGTSDAKTLRGIAFDVSPGGMGVALRQFLPRMCAGCVRVLEPHDEDDDTPSTVREVIFEHDVRVRRVYLRGNEPTYAVGVSFIDPGPGLQKQVRDMLMLYAKYGARTSDA